MADNSSQQSSLKQFLAVSPPTRFVERFMTPLYGAVEVQRYNAANGEEGRNHMTRLINDGCSDHDSNFTLLVLVYRYHQRRSQQHNRTAVCPSGQVHD
jgi:hypothetical protein